MTALKAAEAAMLEFPQNTTYQIYAGRLSFDLGDYERSMFYFKKLYDADPSLSNTENMFLVLLKTDQPEKSVKYIQAVMQIQGSSQRLPDLNNKVNEIIRLKNQLATKGNQDDLRAKIASDYTTIGIEEAAVKYRK